MGHCECEWGNTHKKFRTRWSSVMAALFSCGQETCSFGSRASAWSGRWVAVPQCRTCASSACDSVKSTEHFFKGKAPAKKSRTFCLKGVTRTPVSSLPPLLWEFQVEVYKLGFGSLLLPEMIQWLGSSRGWGNRVEDRDLGGTDTEVKEGRSGQMAEGLSGMQNTLNLKLGHLGSSCLTFSIHVLCASRQITFLLYRPDLISKAPWIAEYFHFEPTWK